MSKWTKGDWKPYEVEGQTYWPGIDAGNKSIVLWGDRTELCGVQGDSLEEAQANVNLMSAAPDMYEALEDARDALKYGAEYEESNWVIAAIDQALAKARGEK